MILLFGHHKGGVGKSTLAVNVAAELQRQGKDVILVEADPNVHTVTNWAQYREEGGHPPIQAVQRGGMIRASLLDLDKRYDFVVVDAPGKDSKEMRSAMTAANVFVMPLRPSQADLDTTGGVAENLKEALDVNPDLRAFAVINAAPTNVFSSATQEARDYLAYYPDLTPAKTVIHDRRVFSYSLSAGTGVVEMGDSKAKAEIQLLTQEITGA